MSRLRRWRREFLAPTESITFRASVATLWILSQLLPHGFRDLDESFSCWLVRCRHHNRHTAVTPLAYFREDRHFTEERLFLTFGLRPPAPVAEDFDALAVGGREVAHVFHDAENRHVDLLEHRDAFAHDAQRRLLRCGHD